MPKIRVCNNEGPLKDCKKFDSLDDVIEWAREEKNKEIKIGDIVTIEKYSDMYDKLGVSYFQELWRNSEIDDDEIYKIMIHYDYGCNYGVGHNTSKEEFRIKWKVLFIYNDRVFIERHDAPIVNGDPCQILCFKKSGLKKYEEV